MKKIDFVGTRGTNNRMTYYRDELIHKFETRTARVGVVGLGYVGLPLAMEFSSAGMQVVGVDLSARKIKMLNEGQSYVEDVSRTLVQAQVSSRRFTPSTDFTALKGVDSISICVPTPLRKTKDPDLSFILSAIEGIRPILRKGQLLVLESTTYPGTTRELFSAALEKLGLKPGTDVYVAFSPERVDPGNEKFNTKNTPKVIGGLTPDCSRVARALYQNAVTTVVEVGCAEEAEMVKLLENTFRAVNIGLVNEMLMMCDRMNINIWNVIQAASTKPFGFMPFYPGPGIGGHCIPLDPAYLSWKAKAYDFYNRFIELASDVNSNMPRFVVQKAFRALNECKKPIKGSKVIIFGVAYKPNVSDLRESPAIEVIRQFQEMGADVSFFDPYVESLAEEGLSCRRVALEDCRADQFDLGVIVTHHRVLSHDDILRVSAKVLDCRNFFDKKKSPEATKKVLPL